VLMRTLLLLLAATAGLTSFPFSSRASDPRPNILFIAVDDLNHWVGYTGRNPQTRTPNIDRLSKMGVSFTHAYCAAPLCNPARAALMSGKRPSTSACYQNSEFWKRYIPEGIGLTVPLKQAGYYVAGCGKIYHGSTYYPSEWDDYGKEQGLGGDEDEETDGPNGKKPGQSTLKGGPVKKMEGFQIPVNHDLQDSDLADWHIVSYCTNQLAQKHDKPFFLACGLHKPHLPWVVPRKYYDLFPVDDIQLPPFKEDDLKDIPAEGLKMAKPNGDHKQILASGRWKAAVQSYLACIAYTDMNVGRLLDALGKSQYASNTIICFWGDHGWHLGEKHHWRKFTLWEEAARAPMIWVVPGMTKPGVLCERTVDFMSIYPTLCELTATAIPKHVEGVSIRKLLADPKASWTTPGLTTFGYKNHTVRTEEFRYIRYHDGGEEFYDEKKDPYEWDNLAGSSEFTQRKAELGKFMPKENAPPSKGSGQKANKKQDKAPNP
jgi:arylsulfatase A-like enzyme